MSEDALPLRSMLLAGARGWGLEHPVETAKLFGNWRELVGEQVADRCDPVTMSRGVLKIRAATPAWANELRYLAPEVLRRVNAGIGSVPGADIVNELKVVLRAGEEEPRRGRGPVLLPSRLRDARRTGGAASDEVSGQRGPSVSYGTAPSVQEIDRLVGTIGDAKLAAATKRALLAAKTGSVAGPEAG